MLESKIGTCDNCAYENIRITKYNRTPHISLENLEEDEKYNWFCEICSNTFLSAATGYHVPDERLYKSIAWIGNHIISKIEELNSKIISA